MIKKMNVNKVVAKVAQKIVLLVCIYVEYVQKIPKI